jgi:hypothetical protein
MVFEKNIISLHSTMPSKNNLLPYLIPIGDIAVVRWESQYTAYEDLFTAHGVISYQSSEKNMGMGVQT